jgi:hypothetical protein
MPAANNCYCVSILNENITFLQEKVEGTTLQFHGMPIGLKRRIDADLTAFAEEAGVREEAAAAAPATQE